MKIGMIVAVEMDAIFSIYPNHQKLETNLNLDIYYIKKGNNEIYIAHTGLGEIHASCGVQYLVTKYNVEMIVNFGVVGGLTNDMKKHKISIIDRIVHYKFDASEFMPLKVGQLPNHEDIYLYPDKELINKVLELDKDINLSTCCSGDKFIGTTEEKTYLNQTFNGDICDMESSGIFIASEINHLPCLFIKIVSDGLLEGASDFYLELSKASIIALQLLDKVIDTF